jgi:sulfate/thiosulfate transport system substrate-binding protein
VRRARLRRAGPLHAALLLAAAGCTGAGAQPTAGPATLLNVSYDPTRELYEDYNARFAEHWRRTTGQAVSVRQSHGGSGKQARAVIDGLAADVVTLALAYDIDQIAATGRLLPADWQQRLPGGSTPFTSVIIFLVRKGNPKHIRDWDDLARPGVSVITPNPKTSGGARWNYLGAWGWALRRPGGSEASARALVAGVYRNVPVLDAGARGATTTFVERGIGDVLIAWESEALLAVQKLGADRFEVIVPSATVLAEPPVAVVARVAQRHGTQAVARAYLDYLYSEPGQEVAASHFYRPRDQTVAARYAARFPKVRTFTIDEAFGGWSRAQSIHFVDGGEFDRLYQAGARGSR